MQLTSEGLDSASLNPHEFGVVAESRGVSGIHLTGVFLGVAETIVCSFIYSKAFLDTGLPRGNVHERDSGTMRGAIPTHSHNSNRLGSFTSHKNKSVKELWDGTYGFSSLSEN